ncbi:MAG TPA: hypothetical protein VGI95_07185 [Caulobacteraceae bacterium]
MIDAAVGSTPATLVAIPPEQMLPATDRAFEVGHPPIAKGLATADISFCMRANRAHDPLPGTDTEARLSRVTIDDRAGKAVLVVDHFCRTTEVIYLSRAADGDWRKVRTRTGIYVCQRGK